MIDDIVNYSSLSKEMQKKTIEDFKNLRDDEKTIIEIKVFQDEDDNLIRKYIDFRQELDAYNEKQEKKNARKR